MTVMMPEEVVRATCTSKRWRALYVAVVILLKLTRHRSRTPTNAAHPLHMILNSPIVTKLIRWTRASKGEDSARSAGLRRRLLSAPRACSLESNRTFPIYEPPYRHLQSLETKTNPVDGVWWCVVCRHQNNLIHIVGEHPFPHLRCGRCNHIFDDGDDSTQILGRYVMTGPRIVGVPAIDKHSLVPYGQICPACGLTYRATKVRKHKFGAGFSAVNFAAITCHCGERSTPQWYRFSIGPNHDWNGDHLQCYRATLNRRLNRAC